ncbi:hypothetical protein [Frondihabitans australicus]|uniref:Polymer-forming protein n=1 Tax=Frondihabitans australicus TaxID=386892 RepID=A0A495IE45_9MICO|nr:hypothetical protein [Frondihabitans australicus]RKR74267.1 hypothetical protein C8E83_1376 [Frondihabitans australicus]
MRQLTGIIADHLVITDVVDLVGVATADVTVALGGTLIVTGLVSGALDVQAGGLVSIEGAVLGPVTVAWGGHVELLGRALGGIETQGGVVRVGAGSRIGSLRIDHEGRLGPHAARPEATGSIPWFMLPRRYGDGMVLSRVD